MSENSLNSRPPDPPERPGVTLRPLPMLLVLVLTCAAAGFAIYWLIRSARF